MANTHSGKRPWDSGGLIKSVKAGDFVVKLEVIPRTYMPQGIGTPTMLDYSVRVLEIRKEDATLYTVDERGTDR